MAGDVFADENRCPCLIEQSGDVGPEMPGVVHTQSLTGHAEGLTGPRRSDAIHCATPASAVEGADVRPDRSLVKTPIFHARRQNEGCRNVDLHMADDASAWKHSGDGEVGAAGAGEEGQHAGGR